MEPIGKRRFPSNGPRDNIEIPDFRAVSQLDCRRRSWNRQEASYSFWKNSHRESKISFETNVRCPRRNVYETHRNGVFIIPFDLSVRVSFTIPFVSCGACR